MDMFLNGYDYFKRSLREMDKDYGVSPKLYGEYLTKKKYNKKLRRKGGKR